MIRIIQAGFIVLLAAGALFAQAPDVRLLGKITTPAQVLQMAATADGQRFYLLLDNGNIQLHLQDGQLLNTISVGQNVTAIETFGANRLLLSKKDNQQVIIAGVFPRVQISIQGSPVIGPDNAPVTIVIYDDFECPYCAREAGPLKNLLKKYPEQVKLVFKNFPLAMHKHARIAAIAGLAAQKQGMFWPLHDLMFANYQQLNLGKIMELAGSVGLNMSLFEKDMKDKSLSDRINTDIQEGKNIGVRGTPTLFINGRRVQKRSIESLSRMIDEELARTKQEK
jgi:protein-disulfide isomerase